MLEILLQRAKNKDKAALTAILDRFQPLVLALAGRLHGKGIDWDDFFQVGQLALLEAVFDFNPRGRGGFPWYAKRCVYFALYNYRRQVLRDCKREKAGLPLSFYSGGNEQFTLFSIPQPNPEEKVLISEKNTDLRLALARLPQKQRQVIISIYFKGQGLSEIAKEMSISSPSVKGLEKRGLKNLAKYFGQ